MNVAVVAIVGALAGGPAAQSPVSPAASPNANRFDDPDDLLEMALTDPQPHLRLLAATLLRSQPHLVRLMESPDAEIRLRAVGPLTEPRAVARVVRSDPDARVRRIAVRKCRDGHVLRQTALLDEDAEVGASALRDIRDVAALEEIATDARSPATRRLAAGRLAMEKKLADERPERERRARESREIDQVRALDPVARVDRVIAAPSVRRRALLDAVKDDATLHELARRPPGSWGREEGVRLLGGQERLADLALHGADAPLRQLAASRISDPAVAMRLLDESKDAGVRTTLSGFLARHRAVTAEALRRASLVLPVAAAVLAAECLAADPRFPGPAPTKEREEELLARARGEGPVEDRVAAVRRLTEQDALFALARSDPDPGVRAAAAATLTHTHLIEQVIEREANESVRAAAVTRLTDAVTLARLARGDPSARVRRAALCNSRDPAVWRERGRSDDDPGIRAMARRILAAAR